MKKNVRNALAISGLALAIGTGAFTLEANADMRNNIRIQRSHNERIVRTKKIKTERVMPSRRFVAGFVQSVGTNSMVVTRGSKTYTVTVPTSARILNRSWGEISLADIKVGNKIKISGTITDLTVTAKTIRDISLL